ncbi:MAG: OB-fold domain-containing protein [Candidatus Levybacteria bacterium]|nr:OB-fold domain-containing protein [Candidatus Levybacteria bacterium]MDZ4228612.1 OB-fold domain-containing protein [Candidatus Levybacteria bacterium]
MVTSPVKLWRRQKNVASLIGKKGKILLWTIIRVPGKSFVGLAPYPVVIVKMEDGEKMIGQLVDWDEKDLRPGRQIISVLRRLRTEDKEDIIQYNIKFKPL